ncbi:MAG TPA: peptidoglycan DD-metalloendopeptidase family protein [Dehalococcoidia bacterium]|nr:peptidoglycan DD-metalloendopeptidase family protein [Dehalococcoidia bacterium]
MAFASILVGISGGAGAVTHSLRSTPDKNLRSFEASEGYLKSSLVLHTTKGTFALAPRTSSQLPSPTATPTASLTATPQPKPAQPAFFTYTVQPGDTIFGIAAAFGIDAKYIVWNNPEVHDDVDQLLVGQQIVIPSVGGLIYTLKLGDTLSDVASFFGIDVSAILAFAPNNVISADQVSEGMTLLLPGAVPPPPPPPPPSVVSPPPSGGGIGGNPSQPASPAPAPAASATGFIWPFSGPLSSPFGDGRGHAGIDIDGFGRHGAPVVAAASGTVVLVSYLGYGYGYHIIISHGNGVETLYAHLSDIYVSQGQSVAAGEAIGAVGCTGYCTGTHLHFEIRIGGVAVNPLNYLP